MLFLPSDTLNVSKSPLHCNAAKQLENTGDSLAGNIQSNSIAYMIVTWDFLHPNQGFGIRQPVLLFHKLLVGKKGRTLGKKTENAADTASMMSYWVFLPVLLSGNSFIAFRSEEIMSLKVKTAEAYGIGLKV